MMDVPSPHKTAKFVRTSIVIWHTRRELYVSVMPYYGEPTTEETVVDTLKERDWEKESWTYCYSTRPKQFWHNVAEVRWLCKNVLKRSREDCGFTFYAVDTRVLPTGGAEIDSGRCNISCLVESIGTVC